MAVTVSLAVLFGASFFLLVRSGRSTIPTAACGVLFGFCLASTGLAPAIHSVLAAFENAATHL